MKTWMDALIEALEVDDTAQFKPTPDAVVAAYCAVLWIVCIAAGVLP